MEKVGLAQMAYHAYGDWVGWKTASGKPLPRWGELPMQLQNAWTAATATIAIEVRREAGIIQTTSG